MKSFRKSTPIMLVLFFLVSLMVVSSTKAATVPPILINELLAGNASINLDPDYTNYGSWIELVNQGSSSIDLSGYYVSDDPAQPTKWKLPRRTTLPANGYLLLWVDEEGKKHAPFDLDMDGGEIALYTKTLDVIDSVTYDEQTPDVSYGRQPDGSNTWVYFDQPTPEGPNTSDGFVTVDQADAPEFSLEGGFYTGLQTIELSTSDVNATIRYTVDGSIPSPTSDEYVVPIEVTQPTVVRARTFAENKMASPTESNTYLIDVDTALPVVSLATAPEHLWDNQIGIYVAGSNGIRGRCSNKPVNWNQKWERPVSIEMFEIGGERVIHQDAGFEIFGGCSRTRDRKSFEIKAKKRYGDNDIDYQVFDDKPIDEFKRLILRNGGNDAYFTLFRDAMMQELVKGQMDVDWQAYRPAILFLNGEYWGVYSIREKADEAYVEHNYDLDEDEFDMLENKSKVENGSAKEWKLFYRFLTRKNLAAPDNYAYVQSQMDVDEYMNYFITQIFSANRDWPGNNMRYWRAYDGGRWRWVLYDMDVGFLTGRAEEDTLDRVLRRSRNARDRYASRPLVKLMNSPQFHDEFVQRFASHLNTTYQPDRVIGIIDEMQAAIAYDMPAHVARWPMPGSVAEWNTEVDYLRQFASQRPAYMFDHLDKYLGRPGFADLTVNVTGNGDVQVAGVTVPDNGYTGAYFREIPVRLTAVPRPGGIFSHWQETGETSSTISLVLNGNVTRTAVFDTVPIPDIVINEIHYNPVEGDSYEFVELVNVGSDAVDLGGFTTAGFDLTFPPGTTIAPGEYILLVDDAAVYSGNGYQVFQFDGGVSNGGELIGLYDSYGNTVDEVDYDDEPPWPETPDGDGPSLALLDLALDNDDPANWSASVQNGGTPGTPNFP